VSQRLGNLLAAAKQKKKSGKNGKPNLGEMKIASHPNPEDYKPLRQLFYDAQRYC